VIISGTESGGLRTSGPESTNMILVPLVSDMVDIPVVAAGGIADHRGYRAALALGAQGVQIGTAFLASEESPASRAWKEAIVGCGDAGTMRLPLGNMTMRAIINPRLTELMDSGVDLSEQYNLMSAGQAWQNGDFDLFPAGAGQISALIREIRPVGDIIDEMVS
jgi:enoyl-[acyl-carrier protein] reductase II